jgi:hypothetical protein
MKSPLRTDNPAASRRCSASRATWLSSSSRLLTSRLKIGSTSPNGSLRSSPSLSCASMNFIWSHRLISRFISSAPIPLRRPSSLWRDSISFAAAMDSCAVAVLTICPNGRFPSSGKEGTTVSDQFSLIPESVLGSGTLVLRKMRTPPISARPIPGLDGPSANTYPVELWLTLNQ